MAKTKKPVLRASKAHPMSAPSSEDNPSHCISLASHQREDDDSRFAESRLYFTPVPYQHRETGLSLCPQYFSGAPPSHPANASKKQGSSFLDITSQLRAWQAPTRLQLPLFKFMLYVQHSCSARVRPFSSSISPSTCNRLSGCSISDFPHCPASLWVFFRSLASAAEISGIAQPCSTLQQSFFISSSLWSIT